jgi:hypothetical protein
MTDKERKGGYDSGDADRGRQEATTRQAAADVLLSILQDVERRFASSTPVSPVPPAQTDIGFAVAASNIVLAALNLSPTPLAITGVSPRAAKAGDSVTITGANFLPGTTVSFGPRAAANVSVVSSTQMVATAPPGSGTVDVAVTSFGASAVLPGAFSYSGGSYSGGTGVAAT